MRKNYSPQVLLAVCSVGCLLISGIVIALALQMPWTGVAFQATDDQLHIIGSAATGPNPGLPRFRVAEFIAQRQAIPAGALLLIEEPDVLPDYAQYNQLMTWQSQLAQAVQAEQLLARAPTGDEFLLQSAPRPLTNLPLLFWLQLMFGIGGALTGALVWSTRRHDLAAQLYALTGVGYLIFAPAAAIYSTRELILNGEIFRSLSAINHFGALMFTASLTSLLSCYPTRIKGKWLIAAIYLLAVLVWLADTVQMFNPAAFHFGVLGVFLLSFVFAFMQWQRTRANPVGRAALRWFLLAIYLATGLFAAVIIIPAALHLPQPASQGVMFGAFLLMYWGLALGIVHYRLFNLEQWWHSITAWFMGGLCVLLLDIVLITSLALPQEIALSLAVALTGWLYFPVRQFLWDKLGYRRTLLMSDWLTDVLPLLIERDPDQQSWKISLQRVWQASEVKQIAGAINRPEIIEDGLTLKVPDIQPDSEYHYQIHYADNGQRLFHPNDLKTFFSLQKVSLLARQITLARDIGADQERQRIRRDIHDDMGASLLTLLHSCPPPLKAQVRELVQATRELVHALNTNPVDTLSANDAWQAEAQQRCEAAGVTLEWCCQAEALPPMLSSRMHVNLTRILREAVSNALKHAAPAKIHVIMMADQEGSKIEIINDVHRDIAATWEEGNGCRILRERAEEINGRLSWTRGPECRLMLTLSPVPY